MGANRLSFTPEALGSFSFAAFQPLLWLQRFRLQCAAPDCTHRGKLWSTWRAKARGLTLGGRWYCTAECFHEHLVSSVRGLLASAAPPRPRRHRLPLGLLLVNNGVISHQQLREALQVQAQLQAQSGGEKSGEKLGHLLREMRIIAADDLTAALASQWGCPVYPLDPRAPLFGCQDLLPLPLLEAARAVPVYVSPDGGSLHLAFGERLDHTTLYAVERMLGCRTIACVANEESVGLRLEEMHRTNSIAETSFDTMRDPREIAWTIRSYAGEYRAVTINVARASSYLWVRFSRRRFARDLLFRIRSASEAVVATALPVFSSKVPADSADTRSEGVSNAAGVP
jgi:hypothetical protein